MVVFSCVGIVGLKAAARLRLNARTRSTHASTHINSHTLLHTLNIRLSSPRGANLPSLGAAKATLLSEEERSTPSDGAHHPPSHYHAHRHSEYRTYRRRAIAEKAPGVPMDAVSVRGTQTCVEGEDRQGG